MKPCRSTALCEVACDYEPLARLAFVPARSVPLSVVLDTKASTRVPDAVCGLCARSIVNCACVIYNVVCSFCRPMYWNITRHTRGPTPSSQLAFSNCMIWFELLECTSVRQSGKSIRTLKTAAYLSWQMWSWLSLSTEEADYHLAHYPTTWCAPVGGKMKTYQYLWTAS